MTPEKTLTPKEIDEIVWDKDRGLYPRTISEETGFKEAFKPEHQRIFDQAKRCSLAEAERDVERTALDGMTRDCVKAEAQASALARLIMGLEERRNNVETDPFDGYENNGHNRLRKKLQTEAQQILPPDWKDPLEELYKLIMSLRVPEREPEPCASIEWECKMIDKGRQFAIDDIQYHVKKIIRPKADTVGEGK